MEERLPRKLAAILYADVVEYSRLTGEDEDATHRTLSEYLDLITETIQDHRGEVMHYAGDAVLAKFDAVIDAMSSAVVVQNELKNRNENLPEERKLQFRMGVNSGDVIEDRGDIYGDGVNVAARLEALAEPSGICVSDAVRTAVGNKLGLDYEDMGDQKVKNIERPVRAFRVAMREKEPATIVPKPQVLEPTDKPSIAVLPFDNMSQDADQGFLADGISEDLITELSRIRGFFVIARTSTFAYKSEATDVRRIAEELGVTYVLEGSVRQAGDRVRITAQLVNGKTGDHIWADRYDRVLADIFALQDEITESVATAIEPSLLAAETERSRRQHPASLDAWGLVSLSLPMILSWSNESYGPAEELLKKAIEIDPQYARAHAVLASGYAIRAWMGWGSIWEPKKVAGMGLASGRTAAKLDPQDPWAHMALGFSHAVARRHGDAINGLERSLELNPNFALAHTLHGMTLIWGSKFGEALHAFEKAKRASPRDPMNEMYPAMIATAHFFSGRYQECIVEVQKTIRFRPGAPGPIRVLAAANAKLGRLDEARSAVGAAVKLQPTLSVGWMLDNFPMVSPTDLETFVDALRIAGLPE
jgi:TolB-like protein/cytochrome c-type biogenesis protein CcmH/NrfG